MDSLKVSVSGVRGVVGKTMTPAIAASFGQAFGSFVGKGKVVVGRDTRPSGAMLEDAVIAGLQSVGCRPIQVGIAPTPSILYHTRSIGARGGIAITASHNPAEWNALKFIDRKGLFLDAIHAEELFDVYHQRAFSGVSEGELKSVEIESHAVEDHLYRVRKYVDVNQIRGAGLRVAVDCCNGVGAVFSPGFLEALGCEVIPIFDEPHGRFERGPEPIPTHLGALQQAVVEHECAVGFAQDPDGDRLAVVDEHGQPVGEDLSLGLAALQVLKAHEQGPVVANLSLSQSVKDKIMELGSLLYLTPTGEINVASEMIRTDAVVGGENTGGVIIPAIHPCRDSFAGMAVILELLASSEKTVSQWVEEFASYHLIKDKITIRPELAPTILRCVRDAYADHKVRKLDGIYVDFDDGWIQIRRSNTEPVVRILSEAKTRERAEERAEHLRDLIRSCE